MSEHFDAVVVPVNGKSKKKKDVLFGPLSFLLLKTVTVL